MKKFLNEFKDFALKGNVFDMAIGVVVGSAFTAIVNSLVKDVITPIIGVITGGVDFTSLTFGFKSAQIGYGAFIQAIINFLIIAFTIFMVVKAVNSLHRKKVEEVAPEEPKKADDILLLEEIRDLLKNR